MVWEVAGRWGIEYKPGATRHNNSRAKKTRITSVTHATFPKPLTEPKFTAGIFTYPVYFSFSASTFYQSGKFSFIT